MDLKALLSEATERDWQTEEPEAPLRFAVVGLGTFGKRVALPALDSGEYVEPAVVVSGSPEKAQSVAGEYEATAITYEEYHDGTAESEYEAVYVATPNATHLDFVEPAADRDKHVVCEKPLEATTDRAESLVEAMDDSEGRLMTAYRMQTTPLVRRARYLVEHGAIGTPVRFEGSFNTKPLRGGSPGQWRFDDELAGGGALPDIGIYPLNTVRFLLEKEPVAVSGLTASPDVPFQDVDEHVAFTLEFEDGVQATGQASFNAEPDSRLRVVGTEGLLDIEPVFDVQATRTLTLQRGIETVSVTASSDEVAAEFEYFAHAVRTDGPIEPDGADGLADMRLIEAIYDAADSGSVVDV